MNRAWAVGGRFIVAASLSLGSPAGAGPGDLEQARPERVRAHVAFLSSEALRGRGSATEDEAAAADYVAGQFAAAGLSHAPGMSGYVDPISLTRHRQTGPAVLRAGGRALEGMTLLQATGGVAGGRTGLVRDKAKPLPRAAVLIVTDTGPGGPSVMARAEAVGAELLIVPETEQTREMASSGRPSLPIYPRGEAPPRRLAVVTLPAPQLAQLAATAAKVTLTVPFTAEEAWTRNVIGFLPGRDRGAGVLLLSAHIDHLGCRRDGTIMPGANDDASGVAAVIELARALAAGPRTRRAILFVGYGSEEIGGFGARRFAARPPVPLSDLAANIQFEMIGQQDPKLPTGRLMMTGFERSTLGTALQAAGAPIAPDPYPEEGYFERSDNFPLALKGVVAHTVAGWAGPTYHEPTDTVDKLDLEFMAETIAGMAASVRTLANSSKAPRWNQSGRPTLQRGGWND